MPEILDETLLDADGLLPCRVTFLLEADRVFARQEAGDARGVADERRAGNRDAIEQYLAVIVRFQIDGAGADEVSAREAIFVSLGVEEDDITDDNKRRQCAIKNQPPNLSCHTSI